jgi:hypothetical protein
MLHGRKELIMLQIFINGQVKEVFFSIFLLNLYSSIQMLHGEAHPKKKQQRHKTNVLVHTCHMYKHQRHRH